MASRGRGGGRRYGGFGGGGGFRPATQVSFELFPEIEGLGTAEYSTANIQLIKWSWSLQKDCTSFPYYYEDRSERRDKLQKLDIERYSDRKLKAKKVMPPLWHFIKLDPDHMPAELGRGEKKEKHVVKKVRWNPKSDLHKLDLFEKLEQKHQGQEGTEKKENEDEEEEEEEGNEEDEGEFSDEGDYEQAEYFDDDEDDYNMAEDNNDEPSY